MEASMRIGVDAGGTFTDFVILHDDGRLETFKLRSNPHSPASVILAGLRHAAGSRTVDVVHGSTVATNALLERKGVRTAFVTTAGFEDMLEIGRQNRPDLYNLTPPPRPLLVPRELCFGVAERALHNGTVARCPTAADLKRLAARLKRSGAQAIAICFLHSYRNPANEKSVSKALAGLAYLSTSYEISPEFREYERATTTAVNAYIGPLMDTYLGELQRDPQFRISILQSNGGFLSARDARRHAVRTVLSGPAGGVIGAQGVAEAGGHRKLLCFDMGGTSTDVSLIDTTPRETTEAVIDGLPIRVPMLDIHTVGAGGGSIARVDAGGLLRVGPESAGSDPGPACYGKGVNPTVTDAHVVLGRMDALLGGAMIVDRDRAASSIDRIAKPLNLTREAAAAGVLRVANANMERAIRVVSVERGFDPHDFALVAFGGGGGLHACEIAEELGIQTVLVPLHAGALSALGMLLADAVRDYSAGVLGRTDIEQQFRILEQRALRESPRAKLERSADLRYQGQSYELNVPWPTGRDHTKFQRQHARTFGYALPERPVEVVTLRVRARVPTPKPRLLPSLQPATDVPARRRVWIQGRFRLIPAYSRRQIIGREHSGPALILDYGSTTLVPATWKFHLDHAGNLVIQR
jgi:N-methylhydantoinase A